MKERVYIETTFVSYLKARPSRDLLILAHQELTREWWDTRRDRYEFCVSQLVVQEASAGDEVAAKERLEVLAPMMVLDILDEAKTLANALVNKGALPAKANADALHIAVAATHAIPFLLTWNCRHLANAAMRPIIESVCGEKGFKAPIICTPEELMEQTND